MEYRKYELSQKVVEEIARHFTYHAPHGDQAVRYQAVRYELQFTALRLARLCPGSQELSIALTNLQEAMFWANASIARNEAPPENAEPVEAAAAESPKPRANGEPVEAAANSPRPTRTVTRLAARGEGIEGIASLQTPEGKVLGYVVGAEKTWFAFATGPDGERPIACRESFGAATAAAVRELSQ